MSSFGGHWEVKGGIDFDSLPCANDFDSLPCAKTVPGAVSMLAHFISLLARVIWLY